MNTLLRTFGRLAAAILILPSSGVFGAEARKGRGADMEAATRLQILLDRAGFSPGKIDGHYGEFTLKALALYREAQGGPPSAPISPVPKKSSGKNSAVKVSAPNLSGLDLAAAGPPFIDYTVQEVDLQSIGPVPGAVAAQAKLKSLPYHDATEAMAEKFHTDAQFLASLNPGKTKAVKAGVILHVPNVEPFELASVKNITPGSEAKAAGANDVDGDAPAKTKRKSDAPETTRDSVPNTTTVKVDTKTNMLTVYEADKLVAAYPVTIGSAQTESPIGEWKVRGIAKMPTFRYDKAMLNHGQRSNDFHLLPPGPNNPVGVMWIQLNKKGIGLHGTNEPDSIGRSASHGCVRLANWDVVRLATKIQAGVPVSIR